MSPFGSLAKAHDRAELEQIISTETRRTPATNQPQFRRLATAFSLLAGFALVLGSVVADVSPAIAAPVTVTVGGMTFTADNADVQAGATLTSYDAGVGGLSPSIPPTITDGTFTYSVTAVADNAFYFTSLNSVIIPPSVLTIGEYAFGGNNFTTIAIPDSVTTISNYAFAFNSSLSSATIGNSVTSIGFAAFFYGGLTSLTLGDSLVTIGDLAFLNNSLGTVNIPDTVVAIGDGAFSHNSVTTLTLGNSVATMGEEAFGDNDITTLTVPASVTAFGLNAFADNVSLTEVNFLGAAPTTFTDIATDGSLGAAPGPTVNFRNSFASPTTAGGFTTPTWQGYNAARGPIITFDLGGHGTAIAPADAGFGLPAVAPAAPTDDGWAFTGWFTDATLTTPFDFATPITSDSEAFAAWDAVPVLAKTGATTPILPLGALAALLLAAGVAFRLSAKRPVR